MKAKTFKASNLNRINQKIVIILQSNRHVKYN